jgi:1-phosphofructokinase family hexose kinase
MKVLCCGIFPALQRTLELTSLRAGAVNRVRSVTLSVGGKATNAARVLKALGTDPLLIGFAGGDNGAAIKRLLDAEEIAHAFVGTQSETRVCQTLLADDAADFTELVEDGPQLPPGDWQSLLQTIQTLDADSVIISGTLPTHAPPEIYADILRAVQVKPVILDCSGPPLLAALKQRPALVKVNRAELLGTMGRLDELQAAREMLARGARAVVATAGGEPTLLVTSEEAVRFIVPRVDVKSTLGCGDSVNAGIAFRLNQGASLKEALTFGLACGASNAMNRMPGVVQPEQIANLVERIEIEA